jgi:protein phosphatase
MATLVGTRQESPPAVEPGVAVLRAGAAMDLGRRVDQEDALGLVQPGPGPDAERGSLFVLADGLGGHAAGELASRLAVSQIVQSYYSAPAHQPGNLLQSAITAAHSRVRVAAADPGRHGMGTTCVCAAVQGDRLWVANVGDSRAYLVRPSEGVLQLTQDHSLAAEQVRQGVLTPEAAATSPMRNVLIQSLGTATPPQPYFAPPLHLHRGDLVLLCSDGLYGALETPALRDYLLAALASMREVQPDLLARDLLAAALFHGAEDNVSALVICCTALVPPAAARGQVPARRLFLPASPETESEPLFVADDSPAPAAEVERTVWDLADAALPTPVPESPAHRPLGLDAGLVRPARAVPPRPAARRTNFALGALGLLGLLLLAGGIVVAPFSALWVILLLALVLLAGLLLFVVAFLPATAAPVSLPSAGAVPPPAPPADRGWGDEAPADLAGSRPLIADLLGRVLPGPPAPWQSTGTPADRALPAPPGVPTPPAPATPAPPEAAVPSYVNQAFSEALERARHQWTFNLLVAFGTAGLIVVGIAISVTWVLSGASTVWAVLLGPGATLVGVINWLLTRPAAQLSRADNQISLLSLVWTSYAQELRRCTAMPDPAAAAACTGRAGADAVNYFNAILSHPDPPAT